MISRPNCGKVKCVKTHNGSPGDAVTAADYPELYVQVDATWRSIARQFVALGV